MNGEAQPVAGVAGRWSAVAAVLTLAALVIAVTPLFACMPPWVDTSFFDVCARTVLEGRPVYREILVHGPPGMVLAVAEVRRLCGWRSEVLGLADLAVVGGAIGLLAWRCLPVGVPKAARLWTAVGLLLVYTSTTEWGHCQPDPWMLLPGLVGLSLWQPLRASSTARGASGPSRPRLLLGGLCWSVAAVFKPFVVVPAVGCWLGAMATSPGPARSRWLARGAWALAGALVPVAVTASWLQFSDNWPDFLAGVAGDWNRDYYLTSAGWSERVHNLVVVLWPWGLLQLVAVPAAVAGLVRHGRSWPLVACRPEVAGCYLGWFLQAHFIQRQTPYQVLPAVLLAWTVLSGEVWPRRLLLVAILGWSACCHPLLQADRLILWPRCWREGSTPEVRDLLTLEADSFVAPSWRELERVQSFLAGRGVGDRELTCYSLSTVPLYVELGVRPSTRFVLLHTALEFFPSARPRIARELAESPQRYVVNDLRQVRVEGRELTREEAEVEAPGRPLALPPAVPAGVSGFFPFNMPIVYRAGRYVVHEVPSRGRPGPSAP